MNWLDEICKANDAFLNRIDPELLPVQRTPWPCAVITCMDPRINLSCMGIPTFDMNGGSNSHTRIIRTIGGLHDIRSLVIGIHLAGFKEVAVLMHTDCGCSLAVDKVETIISNMKSGLTDIQFEAVKTEIGEPFEKNLLTWLGAFEDPYQAVEDEIYRMRASAFIPKSVILHGLVYDLASGSIDVIVNGYDEI